MDRTCPQVLPSSTTFVHPCSAAAWPQHSLVNSAAGSCRKGRDMFPFASFLSLEG